MNNYAEQTTKPFGLKDKIGYMFGPYWQLSLLQVFFLQHLV